MAFHVHTASRAEAFVNPLAALLATPTADPLAAELVGIPTRGMERWLAQRLAQILGARPGAQDGICANVEFRFLGGLIGTALAGPLADPAADPWHPDRAVWPLIETVDELGAAPWLGPLVRQLARDGSDDPDRLRRGRRYGVMRHVADLFDRYQMHRPEMVASWAAGGFADGAGGVLAAGAVWQAELWRALRGRIGVASPAERLDDDCARIRAQPHDLPLPPRIAIVGVSRVPASHLRVLEALADAREVHLFALHPSPELWDRMAARRLVTGPSTPRGRDRSAEVVRHPLVAAWGRDARELQIVLGAGDRSAAGSASAAPTTLLGRLQADIRADRAPAGAPWGDTGPDRRPELGAQDASLQVHACHGRARQVEVLRDALLHMFADDPSLEPREVVVMCPDLDAFAPLVTATFAGGDDSRFRTAPPEGSVDAQAAALRVRVSDRSQRERNPLIAVLDNLLRLGTRRVTANEVLELATSAPVRRRFVLDDDDLDQFESWVRSAEIRWGLDGAARARFGLDGLSCNTWREGMDRLLAGVAMADEDQRTVAGVVPVDSVESGMIDLAGRVAEFVERLADALRALERPGTPAEWCARLSRAIDGLALAAPDAQEDRVALEVMLSTVEEQAGATAVALDLAELRALLAPHISGAPGRTAFRTGALTVTSMEAMRGVPHRVVCLLGLDDAVFPAKATRDGDDLMLAVPRCGDRDGRSESLAQLLDAVMAAGERLVITYSGRNELTNVEIPPAVPVGELLDACAATVRVRGAGSDAGRAALGDRVWLHHPLQPFDARNFIAAGVMDGRVWSFDSDALAGARALQGPRRAPRPFLEAPLAPLAAEVIELDALVRFVEHPCREFLRTRLGVRVVYPADAIPDELPVELDPLETWRVGDRVLRACLAGVDLARAVAAERARGAVAPGALGGAQLDAIARTVEAILDAAGAIGGPPRSVPVDVQLADGRRVVGIVPRLRGSVLLDARYGRLAPKSRAAAWVRLLALTLADPAASVSARLIGRPARRGARAQTSTMGPVPATAARAALGAVAGLYDDGMSRVPLLFAETSARYAEVARRGEDPWPAAAAKWDSEWQEGESADRAHRMIFGRPQRLASLRGGLEPRFGEAALALWGPLMDHEH
jgi:exodeoxyribonuclease V gamma subunit